MEYVNAFLNDPGEPRLPFEHAWPSSGASHFRIDGWTGQSGTFQPGTVQFQGGHLAVILSNTYDTWARNFGSAFGWQCGGNLLVEGRAGQDLNSYYDRLGLKFYFGQDSKSGTTIYSCESCDVVAHECGHAVLDAHHSDYWDSLHPETAAFHEAFGDISALLITLGFPSVRAALLKETGGDLTKSNGISRLAEQLARALYDDYGTGVCSPAAMRDLVNHFRYKPSDQLPGRAPAAQLSSESHNYSRVFGGAFYEILIGIYGALRRWSPSLRDEDALVQARDNAGELIAQAVMLAPPGDATFQLIAIAMVKADQQFCGGKFFPLLRRVFQKRGILDGSEADAIKPHVETVGGKTKSIHGVATGAVGKALTGEPSGDLGEKFNLKGDEEIAVHELGLGGMLHTIQYRVLKSLRLRGKSYGVANGALVPVQQGLTLTLRPDGRVMASHLYRADTEIKSVVRDHIEKLADRNRIFDRKPGDKTDVNQMIANRQPYFIAYDGQGNKLVRRAFIACEYC